MTLAPFQYLLGGGAGALVGFTLGLTGGGGSILAVPLMVYFVGVRDAHLAIGTSALAVAANAALNLLNHARGGTVKWRVACLFAAAGVAGAAVGSALGKAVDGARLLALFALLMIAVGVVMLRRRAQPDGDGVPLDAGCARKVAVVGGMTGMLSGFFGIGGGFLIVPGLMYSARLPIFCAVGSSLVAVTAFGLTTALSYALSGWVDWALALAFVAGGLFGGLAGARVARGLAGVRGALNLVFAALIFAVALYMLYRSAGALHGL